MGARRGVVIQSQRNDATRHADREQRARSIVHLTQDLYFLPLRHLSNAHITRTHCRHNLTPFARQEGARVARHSITSHHTDHTLRQSVGVVHAPVLQRVDHP